MAPPRPQHLVLDRALPKTYIEARQVASSTGPAAPALPTAQSPGALCVFGCIRLGDSTECDATPTQACLCNSGKYIASVAECFTSKCAPEDALMGADFSYRSCLALGVNVSTIATPTAAPSIDITSAPVVYSQTFVNVQAIMSSVCAALLALALVLGFFACRARVRHEAQTQQGSWSNLATGASRTGAGGGMGGGKSFGGVSRGPVGVNSGFDPTATFASASYPMQTASRGMGLGMERNRGFTNRLTLDESEEWEMDSKRPTLGDVTHRSEGEGSGSGSGSGTESKDDLELGMKEGDGEISPVTFTTHGNHSEVDLDGSTVHLARLDRVGDGTAMATATTAGTDFRLGRAF